MELGLKGKVLRFIPDATTPGLGNKKFSGRSALRRGPQEKPEPAEDP